MKRYYETDGSREKNTQKGTFMISPLIYLRAWRDHPLKAGILTQHIFLLKVVSKKKMHINMYLSHICNVALFV